MFINLTNHPSDRWSEKQINAAKELGLEIKDIKFPNIPSNATEADVFALAKNYYDIVVNEFNNDKAPEEYFAVLLQGEMTFCYRLASMLSDLHINVYAACSERVVTEKVVGGKTMKTSEFEFVKFRKY